MSNYLVSSSTREEARAPEESSILVPLGPVQIRVLYIGGGGSLCNCNFLHDGAQSGVRRRWGVLLVSFRHDCLAFLNCPFGGVSRKGKHEPLTMTHLEVDIVESLSSSSFPNHCLSFDTTIILLGIQPQNIPKNACQAFTICSLIRKVLL